MCEMDGRRRVSCWRHYHRYDLAARLAARRLRRAERGQRWLRAGAVAVYRSGCRTGFRRADTNAEVAEQHVRECDARGCPGEHRHDSANRCEQCDGDGYLLIECPFGALVQTDVPLAIVDELATYAARGHWTVLATVLKTMPRVVRARFVSFVRWDGAIEEDRACGLREYGRQYFADQDRHVPGEPFGIVACGQEETTTNV